MIVTYRYKPANRDNQGGVRSKSVFSLTDDCFGVIEFKENVLAKHYWGQLLLVAKIYKDKNLSPIAPVMFMLTTIVNNYGTDRASEILEAAFIHSDQSCPELGFSDIYYPVKYVHFPNSFNKRKKQISF